MTKIKILTILLTACLHGKTFLAQDILAEEITIACGSNFFSEVTQFRQHALIVRGLFCGDSYMWAPISEGDQITEIAYRNEMPFTGSCVDLDTAGILLSRYHFKDGWLCKLEEFHENGNIYTTFNYAEGVPQGPSLRITPDGVLDSYFFFEKGKRTGFYYLTRDRTDWGLPPCVELGEYLNEESVQLSKPCFSDQGGE